MMKKFVLVIIFFVTNYGVNAQCSMCKAVVESEIDSGGLSALGINKGILYLMIIPYLLIMGVGYVLYKNYKKNRASIKE
jgi:hypothetical protein